MIEESTILILGAGASKPYDYPIGVELKKKIIKNLNNMVDSNSGWVNELGFSNRLVKDFNVKFNLSKKYSIDSFLNYQNEEFVEIGKMAIVDAISGCESDKLFKAEDDDWYAYLINNLYNCSFNEISKNKLSIITYNYDRSLETILFTSLLASYTRDYDFDKCSSKLKDIPIIHMYGRLDPLPWESKNGRNYGNNCSSEELKEMSKKINLIYETKDIGVPKKSSKLIENATNIYFLGLDLRNKENLELLDPGMLLDKNVFGTMYGLKEAEKNQIIQYFRHLGAKFTPAYKNMKTLEAIRYYAPLK